MICFLIYCAASYLFVGVFFLHWVVRQTSSTFISTKATWLFLAFLLAPISFPGFLLNFIMVGWLDGLE